MEKKKYSNLADYLDSLKGNEKELMMFFIDYMRLNHSELEEIFSFQMPTYKLGEGKIKNYIACKEKGTLLCMKVKSPVHFMISF